MKNLVNGEDENNIDWWWNVSAAFLPSNTSHFQAQSTHKLHIVLNVIWWLLPLSKLPFHDFS